MILSLRNLLILYLKKIRMIKMIQNYLLDTNAYFNLLKLVYQYKDKEDSCPEKVKKLKESNLFISTVTKVEIISVLGKYARGNNGGYNKCNCVIDPSGLVCSHYKYTAPRKKWSNKQIKAWLQLIDETVTGKSAFTKLDLLPFSEQTISEAQAIHREVEVEEVCIKVLARCTKT